MPADDFASRFDQFHRQLWRCRLRYLRLVGEDTRWWGRDSAAAASAL